MERPRWNVKTRPLDQSDFAQGRRYIVEDSTSGKRIFKKDVPSRIFKAIPDPLYPLKKTLALREAKKAIRTAIQKP